LLLGTTGSGKSTTIHYLAGSKMRSIKVYGISHIEPVGVLNSDLKEVISSWKAKSETRFVTSIDIKHNGDTITLADTPGSEDTQSAEIEFANILGVKKAIALAKSVRPVILFSW
jgi:predicted GTPase